MIRHEDPPTGWRFLIEQHLGASARLGRDLWASFCTVCPAQIPTLAFAIAQLDDVIQGEAPRDKIPTRCARLTALMTPRDLFTASVHLSPEGPRRRRDVVEWEASLLANVTSDGRWK
jgi:hypothetical protein